MEKGKLKVITSKSGHYRPGSNEMLRALDVLVGKGVLAFGAVVYPDVIDKQNKWYGASEWQEAKGKEDKYGDNPPLTRSQVLQMIPKAAQGPKLMDRLPKP